MIKIVGRIDLEKVTPPEKPVRFVIVSKNRKKALDVKYHHNFGSFTQEEAKLVCQDLNQKWDGRFYWFNKIV